MALASYSYITIPEAQDIVLNNTPLLGTEKVDLSDACGRIVSETVIATDDLPPFPASIKVDLWASYAPTCHTSLTRVIQVAPLTAGWLCSRII